MSVQMARIVADAANTMQLVTTDPERVNSKDFFTVYKKEYKEQLDKESEENKLLSAQMK